MATPRPAKRRRTASPELAAPPLPAPAAQPAGRVEAGGAGTTLNASGSKEDEQDKEQEADEGLTEEQLEEMTRIYEAIAEDYHDIVAELPLEYHRTFALMRELEEQQQAHSSSLRTTLESYISALLAPSSTSASANNSAAPSPAASTSTSEADALPKIPPAAKEKWAELGKHALGAIRAAEDKVGLAVGLYESVDRHIRRLDADLAKYEDSLVIGLREGTLPSHDAPAKGDKSPPGATTSRGAIALGEHESYDAEAGPSSGGAVGEEGDEGEEGEEKVGEAAKKTRKGRKGKSPAEVEKEREWKRRREVQKMERKEKRKEEKEKERVKEQEQEQEQAGVGMPIDPNEPVYCFCRRVSFGEMIACENDDCPREWFHLDCVNLTEAPEGSWYCGDCIKALNIDPKTMKPR